jgi:hypothetical protein
MPTREKPVSPRFIMMGGFGGPVRTMALVRLARQVQGAAKRLGIVKNKQAEGLKCFLAGAEHQS